MPADDHDIESECKRSLINGQTVSSDCPNFAEPPLVELVLGVQFEPLGLTNSHLGWYWRQYLDLGADWPKAEDAQRIPEVIESFGDKQSVFLPRLQFRFESGPTVDRVRFHHVDGDRMVQVQDTKFFYNWTKKDRVYPRYSAIREEFNAAYKHFVQFLLDAKLSAIRPNQWEITYVNHVPRGHIWTSTADWAAVLPGLLKPIAPYGGTNFEVMSGQWRSEIPPQRGRLHIECRCQEMKKSTESVTPALVLTLTARGPISEDQTLEAGLDLGHKVIVRTFLDISSEQAHSFWGRT